MLEGVERTVAMKWKISRAGVVLDESAMLPAERAKNEWTSRLVTSNSAGV